MHIPFMIKSKRKEIKMSNKSFRAIIFVFFTFTVVMSVLFLDSMPNHRMGYGDYDAWLTFIIFPIIFLLHGVLSGIVLDTSQKRLYVFTTLLMLIVIFFLNGLAIDGTAIGRSTVCGLISGVCYTTVSTIGMLVYQVVMKLIYSHTK